MLVVGEVDEAAAEGVEAEEVVRHNLESRDSRITQRRIRERRKIKRAGQIITGANSARKRLREEVDYLVEDLILI